MSTSFDNNSKVFLNIKIPCSSHVSSNHIHDQLDYGVYESKQEDNFKVDSEYNQIISEKDSSTTDVVELESQPTQSSIIIMPSTVRDLSFSNNKPIKTKYQNQRRYVKSANGSLQKYRMENNNNNNTNNNNNNNITINSVQCFDLFEPPPASSGWVPYRLGKKSPNTWAPLSNQQSQLNNNNNNNNNSLSQLTYSHKKQRPATTANCQARFRTYSSNTSTEALVSKLNIIDLNKSFNDTCVKPLKYSGRRINEIGYIHSTHMNTKIFDYHEYQRNRTSNNNYNRPKTTSSIYRQKPLDLFFTNCFQVNQLMPQNKQNNMFRYSK